MKKSRIARTVLAVLVLLTLAFIFTQSSLPRRVSERESSAFGRWLSAFFSPTALGRWILKNLRKVAHFCEYGFLSCEVGALYFVVRKDHLFFCPVKEKCKDGAHLLAFGFFVAFLDETIQIFSNRGPMILDVWIDFAGFSAGIVAATLVALLVFTLIKKKKAAQ